MTLSGIAGHLAGLVEAALATHLRTLDRLAVHTAGAGGGITRLLRVRVDRLAAHPLAQGVVQILPSAVFAPLGEVIVDTFPGTKLLGKHPPLAPRLVPVEDAVHDRSEVFGPWTASMRG